MRNAFIRLCLGIFLVNINVTLAEEYPVGNRQTMFQEPFLVGSLRNMDKIFPTREISRSGPVSRLRRGPSIEPLLYAWGGSEFSLKQHAERQETTGLLILHDNKIVYEQYFLGFSYWFRPGRSQHDALDALAYCIHNTAVNCVLDLDIQRFFDASS